MILDTVSEILYRPSRGTIRKYTTLVELSDKYREPQSPWKTGIAGFDMWYCKAFVIVFVIVQQSW
jgi:hypothetical protein